MKVVKANSYLGKKLIKIGENWEGKFLNQIYNNYSHAKEEAWNDCYQKCIDENGEEFGICSHNVQSFTVSWFTHDGLRIETSRNSYLVVFDD